MIVLIKALAGSHLFGTNTPNSDTDYKGVYLPSGEQILLGNYSETIQKTTGSSDSKNNKNDVDSEFYSLKKFLKMISNGDTAALELLFTPEESILEKHPLWDYIVSKRDELISSKVTAMIGYARQQANKYGIKGSRMGELNTVIICLKDLGIQVGFRNPKLKHVWKELKELLKECEHVHFITLQINNSMENEDKPGIDILGKKFDHDCGILYVLEILTKIHKNYGNRAREAKNNKGIDWKALSHAARVSIQGLELLTDGKITLPLEPVARRQITEIKLGEMPYKEVQKLLENLLEELEAASKSSELKPRVEQSTLDEILLHLHTIAVKDL